jgi:hypothetical protein
MMVGTVLCLLCTGYLCGALMVAGDISVIVVVVDLSPLIFLLLRDVRKCDTVRGIMSDVCMHIRHTVLTM